MGLPLNWSWYSLSSRAATCCSSTCRAGAAGGAGMQRDGGPLLLAHGLHARLPVHGPHTCTAVQAHKHKQPTVLSPSKVWKMSWSLRSAPSRFTAA